MPDVRDGRHLASHTLPEPGQGFLTDEVRFTAIEPE